jgi:hypothetical protein
MLKKLHICLLLLAYCLTGNAQSYPITISTQLTQPSPIYLSNYADATTVNSPVKVQLMLNDLTISNRQVRLKCYFQGNGVSLVSNDFVVGATALYLEGGFPLQLTNVDLAPYFQFQNIQGINPNQYAQPLPEGIYSFSVEVYDFATGKKLSRKTSVTTIIFQNEPPFLNLPSNNASIMQQNIQNIVFSWTPRQINVSNVEYEFSLVEIWDKYTPVQNAFAYSAPLYTTTTRATTLQYSLSEPQLIPGKRYAWRIKAKALANAEEVGVFKNNGYSEIYSFTYEVFCTAPLAITTTSVSQDQAKMSWSGAIDNYDYQINYREKNAGSEWYKLVTPREYATISNLKPNTTYEYTVGAACVLGKYTHSTIQELTTMASDAIAFAGCGIKPDPKDLANKTPLPELFPNDVVTAGDFPIVVLKSTGSNGTFSGEGYVSLPFLTKFRKLIDAADALGGEKINIGKFSRIRITFNNIGINTDFKLISGEIVASYDPNWGSMADGDKLLNPVIDAINKAIEDLINSILVKIKELKDDGLISEKEMQEVIVKTNQEKVKIDNANKILEDLKSNNSTDAISKTQEAQNTIAESKKELEKTEKELNAKIKTGIKFVAFGKDFENKETLATMFTNKDLLIKIIVTDTINKIDLGKVKYFLDKKELTITQKDKDYFVNIKADKTTLKEGKNELKILEADKILSKLIIATYFPPTIEFERGDNFTGDYLFDKGYEQTSLKSGVYYETFKVGKRQEDYYTPVLGLNKDKTAILKVNLNNFDRIAEKDPVFKLIIKPYVENKVEINDKILVLDAISLIKLEKLKIYSNGAINETTLTPMLIDFHIESTGEKVGQLEYFCAEKITKKVNLIYTKFDGETSYPNYFSDESLKSYLNTKSMNQLFLNFEIVSTYFASRNKSEYYQGRSSEFILSIFDYEYFLNPAIIKNAGEDYFYVTNLIRMKTEGEALGGVHNLGKSGGFQVKVEDLGGQSSEELTAHEFGHWINIPHTFEDKDKDGIKKIPVLPFIIIHPTQGESKENFMDYNIQRKSWFKLQLLNYNR